MSKGSKEVLVQLLNPSSFPIALHKQEVVGTLHPLDEHNSMACSAGVDTQGSHITLVFRALSGSWSIMWQDESMYCCIALSICGLPCYVRVQLPPTYIVSEPASAGSI